MEEKNQFDELAADEFSDENNAETAPTKEASKQNVEEEMLPGEFESYTWLKNPDIGGSVELEVKRIVRKPGRELKTKATGAKFWTGLKDKNDKRTEVIIETVNNERFNITSWGLYFNLFGSGSEFQKIAATKKSYEGIKVRITHNFNGKDASTKAEDLMKLRDIKTLEEAEAHKAKVGQAMKDGTIYSVTIL